MAPLGIRAIWQLAALYVLLLPLMGILSSILPSTLLIARRVRRNLGLAIGICMMGTAAGTMIYPPLTSKLLDFMPWRSIYALYAVSVLAIIPIAYPIVRRRLGGSTRGQPRTRDEAAARPATVITLRQALQLRAFWAITLGVGALIGANTAVVVSIVHLGLSKGLSGPAAGWLASLIGLGALLGKLGFGVAADRVGQHTALHLGLFASAAGVALLMLDHEAVLFIGAFIVGLSQGGMLPVWAAACKTEFGLANYGRALGWTSAAMIPMILALPAFAGFSFEIWQTYTPGVLAIVGVLLATLICHLFIRAKPPATAAQPAT